ncbi:ROK family protein [Cohnella zeiphila]|uniref:ROK family protein n=1 Tax=Cohnella zeiphila TaxID=2761120 RepID=A0A7X0STF7_9BACL|nr:ROK family protein [Cohnella zeiphila]MBB6735797.1 ROK family protein [Cohnella zeiphila]
MSVLLGGFDIGGTKCAAVLGRTSEDGGSVEIVEKRAFPTPATPGEAIGRFGDALSELLEKAAADGPLRAIGISCGGPLDSRSGLVLSPPNLPGWDRIDVVGPLHGRFGVPVALQNDANACALAEWKWGAGRGASNVIFLTFGTGMGAGLILNGRLYSGANDMAGEVGHMRLAPDGPVGYGKAGSFEGFCSGGGIARLARRMAEARLGEGGASALAEHPDRLEEITAQAVFEAAEAGDELAREAVGIVGRKLGQGLAVLVDVLNPERIVIGSIYARQRAVLEPLVREELEREALSPSLEACEVVPSGLGEHVGDAASLSVAMQALEDERS